MAKKTSNQNKWVKRLWIIALSPLALVFLILIAALLSGLPKVEQLANPQINLATQVYSIDGKVLGAYYKENRSDAKFSEIPSHLVEALLATEDVRFKEHSGVDYWGLFRAIVMTGRDGGASTITQQLAKLQFSKNFENVNIVKRIWQKIREWIIACRIERLYTKDEIISLYLNQYDFVNQAVGIKSAAHVYFNISPDSLNIQQSAMLVGMLNNASLYNPMGKPIKRNGEVIRRDSLVMKRREVVLSQMKKENFLTQAEYDSLRVLPLGIKFQRVSHDEGLAPYFREVLREKVKELLGEKDSNGKLKYAKSDGSAFNVDSDGLKIYTTIDTRMQEHAEWAVHEHLRKELQPAFTKDVSRRKKDNFPFYAGITKENREAILNQAIHESDRYKIMTGKLCPNCNRPGYYVDKENQDGHEVFHCQPNREGCDHTWPVSSEGEIDKAFNTPGPSQIYTLKGMRDTILTPLDSIKWRKTVLHASLMSVDPHTGYVKAWVGGIDFKTFKYDNVYQSARQVGSTFKPIVYATALRMGKRPTDTVDGSAFCWGSWCPKNSGGGYGSYQMKCALANSVNTVSARLCQTYGIDNVINLARRLGITAHLERVGPLSLGAANIPLYQMVGALSTFANAGVYVEPTFILRIEDKNGTAIYEANPKVEQAVDPNTAYEMVTMMKAVIDGSCGSGTGVRLKSTGKPYGGIKYPTAGKTGTTQNNTDGWFMGLTPDLVTGVWVGAQDPTVRFSSTAVGQGANTGLPIYGYYMKKVYADKNIKISTEDFEAPKGYGDFKNTMPRGEFLGDESDPFQNNEYEEDSLATDSIMLKETPEAILGEGEAEPEQ
jgi:penicillin-binding protein 1A